VLKDKLEAIRHCYYSLEELDSIDDVSKAMKRLFSKDSKDGWVDLSSVHKAKGLEANRVFILHPDKLPLERAGQQDWEKQQEQHLHYVALTRAKQELWFVKGS
jgi:DNA helicase II / ATP-dependent DNA helicase PcrA